MNSLDVKDRAWAGGYKNCASNCPLGTKPDCTKDWYCLGEIKVVIINLGKEYNIKMAEKIINHHSREGGRSELSGIKNLTFNSLLMIKYMINLKNDIKKSQKNFK